MPPKPGQVDPMSVILNKGDAVIAHQLLPHRIGINYSANIRYQVYFRVQHKDHDQFRHVISSSKENMWIEYEGLRNHFASQDFSK